MESNDIFVRAENLSVGYDSPLIKDICFNVRRGEIMTLIGPNASGKSTILKTIAGYLRRQGGKVIISGTEEDELLPKERAKKLAVVLTDRIKPDMMTCRDVVETGRYPYTGYFGVLSDADKAAAQRAVETVDIADFADRDFNAISDGQRQRVMLARAICQEPEILILDEPTSYLDIHHKIYFLEILRRLADEKKLAVIVSMHELELAGKIADHAVCINGGRVVKQGLPAEVFTEEVIRDVFDISPELYEKYLSDYYK